MNHFENLEYFHTLYRTFFVDLILKYYSGNPSEPLEVDTYS